MSLPLGLARPLRDRCDCECGNPRGLIHVAEAGADWVRCVCPACDAGLPCRVRMTRLLFLLSGGYCSGCGPLHSQSGGDECAPTEDDRTEDADGDRPGSEHRDHEDSGDRSDGNRSRSASRNRGKGPAAATLR